MDDLMLEGLDPREYAAPEPLPCKCQTRRLRREAKQRKCRDCMETFGRQQKKPLFRDFHGPALFRRIFQLSHVRAEELRQDLTPAMS